MNNFGGYQAFLTEMYNTIASAQSDASLQLFAQQLKDALDNLKKVTTAVMAASQTQNLDLVFSNSVSYLNMFGHITIAWLWLRQAEIATKQLDKAPHSDDEKFYNGKIQAMKYFFNSELPLTYHWGNLVKNIDSTSFDTHPDWL
jgi:hypothetical protein